MCKMLALKQTFVLSIFNDTFHTPAFTRGDVNDFRVD